jgi:hypothetical protein
MPARKKTENRITPPKASVSRPDEVRASLSKLGIDEQDVSAALAAVRRRVSGPAGTSDGPDGLLAEYKNGPDV